MTRSRPTAANIANALGPAVWPVNAAREALKVWGADKWIIHLVPAQIVKEDEEDVRARGRGGAF